MAEFMSRRQFLKVALGGTLGLGALGIGGTAYATRVEPYALEITHLTLPLPNLPPAFDGLTVAQISDWHLGDWMTSEQMLVIAEQVNALKPDVIVVTGDFVSRIWRPTPSAITHSLEALQAPEGVFAVLGNHDHWTDADVVSSAILDAGTVLLNNANHPLVRGDDALYILGVDDVWEQKANLGHALTGIPDGAATILLAHEPDYADTWPSRAGWACSSAATATAARSAFQGTARWSCLTWARSTTWVSITWVARCCTSIAA